MTPLLFCVLSLVSSTEWIDHIEIEVKCWDLIRLIPTFHLQSTLPPYLASLQNGSGTVNFMEVRRKLVDECITRYYQLLAQDTINDDIIKSNCVANQDALWTSMNKKNLIILDVDETLLDQRAEERDHGITISGHHFRLQLLSTLCTRNSKDLIFGIHRKRNSRDKEYGYLVLFRQFLMHFIHKTRQNANFIIYSLADASVIIPHIIMIENFYNYAYQFKFEHKNPRNMSIFKMDYVIGRLRSRNQAMIRVKCAETLRKLVGNLDHFQKIFIVDDRADNVWLSGWKNTTSKIFYLQPPTFNMGSVSPWPHDLIGESAHYRAKDEYFHALTHFVRKSDALNDSATQRWITYDGLRAFLRSQKYLGWVVGPDKGG